MSFSVSLERGFASVLRNVFDIEVHNVDIQSILLTILFCVLTWITVHRKTLSSNTTHRRLVGDPQRKGDGQDPPLSLLFTKISRGVIEENWDLLEEYMEFTRRVGRGIEGVLEEGAGVVEVVEEDDEEGGREREKEKEKEMEKERAKEKKENFNARSSVPQHKAGATGSPNTPFNDLLGPLPPDCHLYVLMFLNYRDLVSCECVNRGWCELGAVCWMGLWSRDFSKVLHLPVLNRAYRRSLLHDPSSRAAVDARAQGFKPGKEGWKGAYFMWRECWLDWIVAGRCGEDECLVIIGGEAFDITRFLNQHPGGFESLVMHSGKDATKLFVDVGHSNDAKKVSESEKGGNLQLTRSSSSLVI